LPNASRLIEEGDRLTVYFEEGKIINHSKNETYEMNPLPDFMKSIYAYGGLKGYIKSRLSGKIS
jgi:3-isopropylmalate/(R)-2-methylmalate dehydratase small subunit